MENLNVTSLLPQIPDQSLMCVSFICYKLLGSSLQQLSKYIPKLLCHVSSLELDGGLNTVCGSYYTPSTGKKKDRGERSVGVSMITALIGRSGEKMDLLQVRWIG